MNEGKKGDDRGRNTGQFNRKPTQKCVRSIDIVERWAEPDRFNVPIVVVNYELANKLEVAFETLLLMIFLVFSSFLPLTFLIIAFVRETGIRASAQS